MRALQPALPPDQAPRVTRELVAAGVDVHDAAAERSLDEVVLDPTPGTTGGSLIGSIVGVDQGDGTPGVLDTVRGTQGAITVAVHVVAAVALSLVLVHRPDAT